MKRSLLFALAAFVALPPAAQAIVWRHDIPESDVLNYGNTARLQGVGKVNLPGWFGTGQFLGIGTGGQAWGISAKHVITTGQTGTFTFEDGGSYAITQAIGFAGTDIAVFKIAGWNRNVFAPTLHDDGVYTVGTDFDSAGYGGHGAQGTLGGNWLYDNKRRGMQTKLTSTRTASFNGETQFQLIDTFDAPNSANVRPVEGFGASGDSGSMLLDDSGRIWGVLSGGQFETYGNINYYAAITPQIAQQIIQTTGVPEPGTMILLAGLAAVAARRRK